MRFQGRRAKTGGVKRVGVSAEAENKDYRAGVSFGPALRGFADFFSKLPKFLGGIRGAADHSMGESAILQRFYKLLNSFKVNQSDLRKRSKQK